MRVAKHWDGTDPGGTPGRIFTASIPQERLVAEGPFLDHITLGLKGAIATAAVTVEDFAAVLSTFTFRVGPDNRIIGNMLDLIALMGFYYGRIPAIGENTDATGNDFVGGVKVPIQAPTEADKEFLASAERTAVTNVATETLSLYGHYDEDANGKKPIHYVLIQHTSAGAAGYETLSAQIVPVGKLVGVIIGSPAASGFTDANIDVSVQRLRILADGKVHSSFNALGENSPASIIDFVTPAPIADLLRNYAYYDLRPSGIDAKAQRLTLQIDVQDASDALRILPVIEIE